jgi:hypothetical protein
LFTQASLSLNNVSNRLPPPVRSKTQNNISRKIAQRKAKNKTNNNANAIKELRSMGLTFKQRKALDRRGTALNENTSYRHFSSKKNDLNLNENLLRNMKQHIPSKPYVKPRYVKLEDENGNTPEYPNSPPWEPSDSPPYQPPNSPYRPKSPKSPSWFLNRSDSPMYNFPVTPPDSPRSSS